MIAESDCLSVGNIQRCICLVSDNDKLGTYFENEHRRNKGKHFE